MNWRSTVRWFGLSIASVLALLLMLPGAALGSGFDPNAEQDGSAAHRSADVSSSSSEEEYDRFLRSATVFYTAVNKDDASLMAQSSAVILQRYKMLPLSPAASIDGLQILGDQLAQTKRSLAVAKPDKPRLKREAASLLLAADAMAHAIDPLWHNYRAVLADDLNAWRNALNEGEEPADRGSDTGSASAAIERLRSHYEVIRTAAMLDADPLAVIRADTVLRYATIATRSESSNLALAQGAVQPLADAIFALFPNPGGDQSAVVPTVAGASWGWTAMMGSFIVTVLTWAGWRRYKDEGVAGMKRGNNADGRKDAADSLLERWRNFKQ